MTTFTPNPMKIEHERLVMDFEENCPNGRQMDADEYRALLTILTHVGLTTLMDSSEEVSDAWHALQDWANM